MRDTALATAEAGAWTRCHIPATKICRILGIANYTVVAVDLLSLFGLHTCAAHNSSTSIVQVLNSRCAVIKNEITESHTVFCDVVDR